MHKDPQNYKLMKEQIFDYIFVGSYFPTGALNRHKHFLVINISHNWQKRPLCWHYLCISFDLPLSWTPKFSIAVPIKVLR